MDVTAVVTILRRFDLTRCTLGVTLQLKQIGDNQAVNFNSLASTPTAIAAHTIDIVTGGGNTVIYANASGTAQNIVSADMEIHLTNVTNVTSADFILHH